MRSVKLIQSRTLDELTREVQSFHDAQSYTVPPVVAYDITGQNGYRALIDYETNTPPHSPVETVEIPLAGFDLEAHLAGVERSYIEQALKQTNGNLTTGARLLGITFRAVRLKIKKYGLKIDANDNS